MEQRQREVRERWRGDVIEKAGEGEKDRASWPTWANNSSEMRVWLKGPACP